MNQRSIYRLKIDLPFLKKGTDFMFYDATAEVYWIDNGKETEFLLRQGLAGYLWLLRTERKYMKLIEIDEE